MYKTPDIPTLKPGRMLTFVFLLLLSNCNKQLKSFPVHDKANLAQTKKKIQIWINLCIFYQDKAQQPLFNCPWIWRRHYSAEMQRKSSLGEQEVPVIYPHSTSGSSACYMLKMRTSKNEWNDEKNWGETQMYSCFMQGMTNITDISSVFAVCLQRKQTRQVLSSLFFPQLVITVALLFEMRWRSPLQSFFSLFTLYKIDTQKRATYTMLVCTG